MFSSACVLSHCCNKESNTTICLPCLERVPCLEMVRAVVLPLRPYLVIPAEPLYSSVHRLGTTAQIVSCLRSDLASSISFLGPEFTKQGQTRTNFVIFHELAPRGPLLSL